MTKKVTEVDISGFTQYLAKRSRPNTVTAYIAALRQWVSWLDGREPCQETAQEYIDLLEELGKANNTIVLNANAIRRYFKWLKASIFLDCPSVYLGTPRYLTKEQVYMVLSACRTQLEKTMVTCLFDTACRVSELLELRTDQIDWANKLITVTRKGGRVAQVNISDKGLEALKEWLGTRKSASIRVFMDYTYQDIHTVIAELSKRCGIHFTPHMLRHSRAVQLLEDKVDIHYVQQALGHRNIGTTLNIYSQLRPMDLKRHIAEW